MLWSKWWWFVRISLASGGGRGESLTGIMAIMLQFEGTGQNVEITEFIKAIMRIAKFNDTTPALVSWILQENNNGQQMSRTAYFKTILSLKTRTSGTSHY